MAFQIGDAFPRGSLLSQSFLTLYLALKIDVQRLSPLDATIQASLASKALFIYFAFLNPEPPLVFGLHRLSQAVSARNLPSEFFGFHQNFRDKESNLLQTLLGMLNEDMA